MNFNKIGLRLTLVYGLLSFLLIACTHSPRKEVGAVQWTKRVRIVKAQDVQHCEMLASLIGETRSGERAQAENDLLRRIARVGGNCAVVDDVVAQGKHIMAYGQGYRCQRRR